MTLLYCHYHRHCHYFIIIKNFTKNNNKLTKIKKFAIFKLKLKYCFFKK